MATIANLAVKISLDDSGFTRGLENTRKKLDSWGSSMRDFGGKMTAGVTAPLIAGGIMLTKWSANLEQTMGATEHLWGSNADSIIAWSKSADKALGMSQDEALTTANRLNGIFTGMGMSMDQAQVKTMELSARFSDLSALMGGSPTEAAEAYTSALMGNYQALDKYNININAAMVEQRALTMTGKESVAQLTAEEKQLAFNALYLEKTADAEGQFGRELKTTSGRLAVNTARAKNAANAFGRLLLPYVNKLLEGFSKMVDWLESLSDTQRKWILSMAAVAAAMGPLLMVVGMLLPGISALIAVIGFLVSPVGLVVVAVAALVAGLIYAYTHFEGFRDVVNSVAGSVKGVLIGALDMAVSAFNKLKDAFKADGWSGVISTLGSMIWNGLSFIFNAIRNIDWGSLIQGGWDLLNKGISLAWDAITSLDWASFIPDFGKWGDWITQKISSIADWGIGKFGEWSDWVSQKLGSLSDWGIAKFGAWTDWLFKITGLSDYGITSFGKWLDYIPNPFSGISIPDFKWPTVDQILEWVFGPQKGADMKQVDAEKQQRNPSAYNDEQRQNLLNSTSPTGFGTVADWLDTQKWNAQVAVFQAMQSALSLTDTSASNLGRTMTALGGTAKASNTIFGETTSTVGMYRGSTREADVSTGSMATNMSSSFSRMSASAASNFAGMKASSAVQMALMAATAGTTGTQMNMGMTGWLAGAHARIAASMISIVGAIRNVASTGYEAGHYAGTMISQGFAAGMMAYLGVIRGAATAMVAAASQAVIAKAMISSPSRLFMQFGEYIGEGLEIGILNSAGDVGRAGATLVGAAAHSLTGVDTSMPALGGAGAAVVNHNYYVMPEVLAEIMNNARTGSDFARQFGTELAMMEGVG